MRLGRLGFVISRWSALLRRVAGLALANMRTKQRVGFTESRHGMERPLPPMDFEAFGGEPRRSEGFWRHTLDPDEDLPWPQMKQDQHLPWPQPDPAWSDRSAFLEVLHYAEAEAERFVEWGFSKCRLCGCQNGDASFVLENWDWPQGLRHYVVDHNVRPSPEFELFLSE